MKIQNKRSFKKPLIGLIAVLLLLGAAGAYIVLTQTPSKVDNKQTSSPDEENSEENKQVDDAPEGKLPPKSPTNTNSGSTYTPPNSSDVPAKTPETPRLERASQSGTDLKVVATLQNASTGSCELQLQRANTKTIKRSTSVVTGPSSYVCSFIVPVADIPTEGTWSVTVLHKKGSGVASSETRSVEIVK